MSNTNKARGLEIVGSDELQSRLNAIIVTVPGYWEQRPHKHFTNHGPAHSERVHRQKLAQLAQELPQNNRLTNDEIFVVSAAAWLYEIGMQSPFLKQDLDFDYHPGDTLSFEQLQQIREKKHLLGGRLILEDSVYNNDVSRRVQLGLIRPADAYTSIIAEVVRWCSDKPLEEVPESLPVSGIPIRIRLLVALLRLADQLYIDGSRVNLDLLQKARLSMKEQAKWWAYHYIQTLPITKGQIPFHYFLPITQKEYIGHIRGLIEPDFEFDNNPTIQYLWEEHQLKLIPHKIPSVQYDQPAGFQREMSREMTVFLRQEVNPIKTKEPSAKPQEERAEHILLVLDYENLLLQLGQEGYFLSIEDTSRLVVDLLREARDRYDGPVIALAIGNWNRPHLANAARMLEERVYKLITVNNNESVVDKLDLEIHQRLQASDTFKRLILVAPHNTTANTVRDFEDQKLALAVWVSNLPEADIFRAIVRDFKPLSQVLELPDKASDTDFDLDVAACILRLDDKLFSNEDGIYLADVEAFLESTEQIGRRAAWWQFWLLNQKVLISSGVSDKLHLNPDYSAVIAARNKRQSIIETLQALSSRSQNVRQDALISQLKGLAEFREEAATLGFLEILKYEGIVYRDTHSDPSGQPIWYLNESHVAVVTLEADRHLPFLVLSLDHYLVREGFQSIHEHSITRQMAPYFSDGVAEVVYELALQNDILSKQESNQKRRHGDDYLVYVSLVNDNTIVGETMRNCDIILSLLNKKWATNGLAKDALWHKLHSIKSFTVESDAFDRWLSLLHRDSIIIHEEDCVRLNIESPLTRHLLGRTNVYGLIRNLRMMQATSPRQPIASGELVDKLARYVTCGNKQEAGWTLDYAKSIKLVEAEKRNMPEGNIDFVYLRHHSFVRQLDGREQATCQALSELVKSKQRGTDGWVPRFIVVSEMERDSQFGFSRGEHDYWLDQAIHRIRCIREKKERGNDGRIQSYLQAK